MLDKSTAILVLIFFCLNLSYGEIIPKKVALRSYRGMYLSAGSDNSLKLASSVLDSEKWTLVPTTVNSEYYLMSFYNTYLQAKGSTVWLVKFQSDDTKWKQ